MNDALMVRRMKVFRRAIINIYWMRLTTLRVSVVLWLPLAQSAAASTNKFICNTLLSHAGEDDNGSTHKVRCARNGFFFHSITKSLPLAPAHCLRTIEIPKGINVSFDFPSSSENFHSCVGARQKMQRFKIPTISSAVMPHKTFSTCK